MNAAAIVAIINAFAPLAIRYGPALVQLVNDIRNAPKDLSDEEVLARWLETKGRVQAASDNWLDSKG